jgi:uncharacterized protein YgiM (DUF1202 family)
MALILLCFTSNGESDTGSAPPPAIEERAPAAAAEVIVDDLDVRSAPSVEGRVIAELEKGDEVRVLDKGTGRRWVKIETAAGEVGWVKADTAAGPTLEF